MVFGKLFGRDKQTSGRIGVDGWRTFHCDFRSVHVGDNSSGPIDYLSRAGDFDHKDQDLEYLVGDPEAVKEAAQAIDDSARVRRGRTAEKILVKQTFELPLESTTQMRSKVADRIVDYWEGRGHKAIAAVHGNGKVQPHIHVAVTARPVDLKDGTWIVDRSPDRVALRGGKQTVRNEREQVAALINTSCNSKFHHGRLIDTGIDREAKKRIPEAQYHRSKVRENDPQLIEQAHARHVAERKEARRKRRAEKSRKNKKFYAKATAKGYLTPQVRDQAVESAKKEAFQEGLKTMDEFWIKEEVPKIQKQPMPLTEDQRFILGLRNIHLPENVDTDAKAQYDVWKAYKASLKAPRDTSKPTEDRQPSKAPKTSQRAFKRLSRGGWEDEGR